ncbi:mevalonate kinase [bacterium]|nr:mevalonate kinase [bacterium]
MKESMFYSKILLFGEYGIIQDAMGLSIPYNFYQGKLHFGTEEDAHSNAEIVKFKNYLKSLHEKGELFCEIDFDLFEEDLNKGLAFDSSIPQGFGVGSSGALVAAVYHKYSVNTIDPESIDKDDLMNLKSIFGQMESYFHGKSSGLDPLICYLNLPVIINSKEDLNTVGLPEQQEQAKGAIFLLNTQSPGETQPMVQIFLEKMKEQGFRNMLKTEFKKYNDACIKSFLKGDFNPLFSNLKQLSTLLLKNFSPMIPESFKEVWKQGIESGDYYLKLCGSGGGGYILGFTQDLEKAQARLKDYQLELVYKI